MRAATDPTVDDSTVSGKRLLALLLAFAPALAQAHPGHAEVGLWAGLLHPLHGLDHVLAALAVGAWAARVQGRALWVLPLAFLAAMAAGIAAAAAGLQLPGVEPVIAASVLLLGSMIVLDARLPSALGAAFIVAFAPFHAAAHAVETPAAASVLVFAAGVLVATALLHASGIALALALRQRLVWLRLAAVPMALAGAWMMLARVS